MQVQWTCRITGCCRNNPIRTRMMINSSIVDGIIGALAAPCGLRVCGQCGQSYGNKLCGIDSMMMNGAIVDGIPCAHTNFTCRVQGSPSISVTVPDVVSMLLILLIQNKPRQHLTHFQFVHNSHTRAVLRCFLGWNPQWLVLLFD